MTKLLKAGLLAGIVLGIASSSSRAVEREAVDESIKKGVIALRSLQRADGTWSHPDIGVRSMAMMPLHIGATALAGLTLLECGVPADDRAVMRAADVVRRASVLVTETYTIAVAILFFDRLGDPDDIPLIESLTLRLMAGQTGSGGWNYSCPPIGEAEVHRLTTRLGQRKHLVGGREAPKPGAVKRTVKDLPKEIQQQLAILNRVGTLETGGGSDNSNTQFATLALWVGRRYGLPVGKALHRVETRFRSMQNADGGWGYMEPGMHSARMVHSTASMTCAGLLGLAVSHGRVLETTRDKNLGSKPPRDLTKDPEVRRGLLALSTAIGTPRRGKAFPVPQVGGRTYYFLWSLERVAVALDLQTIGKKDWYEWGAEILLANQFADGTWRGNYAESGADTCFALLFLRRANLAADLTAQLKGQLTDPGPRVLRGGQLGAQGLTSEKIADLKSGLEGKDAKPDSERMEQNPPATAQEKKTQVENSRPNPPAKQVAENKRSNPPSKQVAEKSSPRPIAKPPVRPAQAPPAPVKRPDSQGVRLADDLVKAPGNLYVPLLNSMREAKGSQFTEALAFAIPKLTGEKQQNARQALVDRLARMKEETVIHYLEDEEAEIRRAAAMACALKGGKVLCRKLIDLLLDPDRPVADAAHEALKELSREDFGPAAGASREERKQAVRKWLDWSAKQEHK
jgi:hypothetical protein